MRVFPTQRDAQAWVETQRMMGRDHEIIRQGRGRFMARPVRQSPLIPRGGRIEVMDDTRNQRSSFEALAAQMEQRIAEVTAIPLDVIERRSAAEAVTETADAQRRVSERRRGSMVSGTLQNFTVTLPDGTQHSGTGRISLPRIDEGGMSQDIQLDIDVVPPVPRVEFTAQLAEGWQSLFTAEARGPLDLPAPGEVRVTHADPTTIRLEPREGSRLYIPSTPEPTGEMLRLRYTFDPALLLPAGRPFMAVLVGTRVHIDMETDEGRHRTRLGTGHLSNHLENPDVAFMSATQRYPALSSAQMLHSIDMDARVRRRSRTQIREEASQSRETPNRLTDMWDPATQAESVFDAALNLLAVPTMWPTQGTATGQEAQRIVSRHRMDMLMQGVNAMLDEHYRLSPDPRRHNRALNSRRAMARHLRRLLCAFLRLPSEAVHLDPSEPARLHMVEGWAHLTPQQQEARSHAGRNSGFAAADTYRWQAAVDARVNSGSRAPDPEVNQVLREAARSAAAPIMGVDLGRETDRSATFRTTRASLVRDTQRMFQDLAPATGTALDALVQQAGGSRRNGESDDELRTRLRNEIVSRNMGGLASLGEGMASAAAETGRAMSRVAERFRRALEGEVLADMHRILSTPASERVPTVAFGDTSRSRARRGTVIGTVDEFPNDCLIVVNGALQHVAHVSHSDDMRVIRRNAVAYDIPTILDSGVIGRRIHADCYETGTEGRRRPFLHTEVFVYRGRQQGITRQAVSLDGEHWYVTEADRSSPHEYLQAECRRILSAFLDANEPPEGAMRAGLVVQDLHFTYATDGIRRRIWISLTGTAPDPVWHLTHLPLDCSGLDIRREAQRIHARASENQARDRAARAEPLRTFDVADPAAASPMRHGWAPPPNMPIQVLAYICPDTGGMRQWGYTRDTGANCLWLVPIVGPDHVGWVRTDFTAQGEYPTEMLATRCQSIRSSLTIPSNATCFELVHMNWEELRDAVLICFVPGADPATRVMLCSFNWGANWYRVPGVDDISIPNLRRHLRTLDTALRNQELGAQALIYRGLVTHRATAQGPAMVGSNQEPAPAIPVALLARRVIDDRETIVDPVGERRARRIWGASDRDLDFDGTNATGTGRPTPRRKLEAF